MSTEFDTIKSIARESLMPDFFGARVDEENLWDSLRQVLTGLRPAAPNPVIDRVKQIAGTASTATEFIDKLKGY